VEKRDILSDEALEALGLLSEIDTLAVINKAHGMQERKNKILLNIFAIMMAFSIVAVNLAILLFLGVMMFLLFQIMLSSLITICFLPLFRKKLI
jgi:hypothetical protein